MIFGGTFYACVYGAYVSNLNAHFTKVLANYNINFSRNYFPEVLADERIITRSAEMLLHVRSVRIRCVRKKRRS